MVVDVRNVAQHNGDMNRDDIAKKGGAIPDSLSFPPPDSAREQWYILSR